MIARNVVLVASAVLLVGASVFAADKKVQLKNLPAVVQKAVQEHTKGATLVGLSEEREEGKVLYEVETTLNGHTRDLLFDAAGTLVEVEEEVAPESLPTVVRTALKTRGKVLKVEAVTKGTTVTYEVQVDTDGKKSEVVVDAAGNAIVRK